MDLKQIKRKIIKNINVLIIVGDVEDEVVKIVKNGVITYSGFHWEIWKQIEKKLKNKYNFKIFFSDNTEIENNYDNYAKYVYNGKYDLVIGPFYYVYNRQKIINYAVPVIVEKTGIIHKPLNSKLSGIIYIISKNFKSIINIFIVGIILGNILAYTNKSKISDYIHMVLSVIFSMFGESGNLIDSFQISIINIIVITIILLSSLTLIMKLQADIIKSSIYKPPIKINRKNISQKNLIGFKGDANVNYFRKLNPKSIKEFEYKNSITNPVDNLIEIYLKNRDKYDGIIISELKSLFYLKKYNLLFSDKFVNKPSSYIISKKHPELLNDINIVILQLKKTRNLYKICLSSFNDDLCSYI